MNFDLFYKKNNKVQLDYYKKTLEKFSKQCYDNTILNEQQKLKLAGYIDRALEFCKTNKYVQYAKIKWKRDKNVLSTSKQLAVYEEYFDYINNLLREIHSDPFLSLKCKRALCSYLGCIHCHIRGKLNRKIN